MGDAGEAAPAPGRGDGATAGDGRPRLALYWGSACGGCEIAVCNTHETLIEIDRHFDFCFCPCLLDGKRADVEALPDGGLFVTLWNGSIRTTENLEMARLLRRKSRILVAFGSCAAEGCVPGLANLASREETLRRVYVDTPTAEPGATPPRARTDTPCGAVELPPLLPRVATLREAVEVDFTVPGCPPEPHQIRAVIALFTAATADPSVLPPRGSVVGAGRSTVCDECPRTRQEKRLTRLHRTYEIAPDPTSCLVDQGLVCLGLATRDGCGASCLRVDAPCIGCYGPPEGVHDQGAKMASVIGSVIDLAPLRSVPEGAAQDASVDAVLDAIPDWVGTLYKCGLAASVLGGAPARRRDRGPGGGA